MRSWLIFSWTQLPLSGPNTVPLNPFILWRPLRRTRDDPQALIIWDVSAGLKKGASLNQGPRYNKKNRRGEGHVVRWSDTSNTRQVRKRPQREPWGENWPTMGIKNRGLLSAPRAMMCVCSGCRTTRQAQERTLKRRDPANLSVVLLNLQRTGNCPLVPYHWNILCRRVLIKYQNTLLCRGTWACWCMGSQKVGLQVIKKANPSFVLHCWRDGVYDAIV